MCRNYDAGECVEEGCTGRITCQDFADQRCLQHTDYLWVEGALEDWCKALDDPGDNPWGGANLEKCGNPDCRCAAMK